MASFGGGSVKLIYGRENASGQAGSLNREFKAQSYEITGRVSKFKVSLWPFGAESDPDVAGVGRCRKSVYK